MQNLYAEYLLLNTSHRIQVLFFVCLLIALIITVIVLSIIKFLKGLAEK